MVAQLRSSTSLWSCQFPLWKCTHSFKELKHPQTQLQLNQDLIALLIFRRQNTIDQLMSFLRIPISNLSSSVLGRILTHCSQRKLWKLESTVRDIAAFLKDQGLSKYCSRRREGFHENFAGSGPYSCHFQRIWQDSDVLSEYVGSVPLFRSMDVTEYYIQIEDLTVTSLLYKMSSKKTSWET